MTNPLSVEASTYLRFRERILLDYPQADEQTLLDTLEGITDLHEMIAAVIRSALVDEALHAGLRSEEREPGAEAQHAISPSLRSPHW